MKAWSWRYPLPTIDTRYVKKHIRSCSSHLASGGYVPPVAHHHPASARPSLSPPEAAPRSLPPTTDHTCGLQPVVALPAFEYSTPRSVLSFAVAGCYHVAPSSGPPLAVGTSLPYPLLPSHQPYPPWPPYSALELAQSL
jgi:hypothetical protein